MVYSHWLYCVFTLTEKSFQSEKLSEKNGFHSNMQKVTHWSETETETDFPSNILDSVPIFLGRHFIGSEEILISVSVNARLTGTLAVI